MASPVPDVLAVRAADRPHGLAAKLPLAGPGLELAAAGPPGRRLAAGRAAEAGVPVLDEEALARALVGARRDAGVVGTRNVPVVAGAFAVQARGVRGAFQRLADAVFEVTDLARGAVAVALAAVRHADVVLAGLAGLAVRLAGALVARLAGAAVAVALTLVPVLALAQVVAVAEVAVDGLLRHLQGLLGRFAGLVADGDLVLAAPLALAALRLGLAEGVRGPQAEEPGEGAGTDALDGLAPVAGRCQRANDAVEVLVVHRFRPL
ncbi:MAG: hypothetical protein AVDCRST_MAG59-1784 [uncultured Thermomicrobiales bacterium]|uniref:Uncharacterized protein n=1 Tax=uncultured Thermomicrobiales bacterium TaxID=1645740 RepID=A0A6J4UIF6_9BACT|nr:MAG: hypothetical protein AVDCRST_MAG59-1784 [uncultured Thermomicrobiales bacterium]